MNKPIEYKEISLLDTAVKVGEAIIVAYGVGRIAREGFEKLKSSFSTSVFTGGEHPIIH